MKKIPCLFVCEYRPREGGRGQERILTRELAAGMEEVLDEGVPTRKWDGTACMVKDGELYKRYDAKRGKTPPEGAIPCQDPNPVTGHWPHWVKVDPSKPEDKWHAAAWDRWGWHHGLPNGTYELCGPHFSANPQNFAEDTFIRHGDRTSLHGKVERTFDGLKAYLTEHNIEGIVFWLDGEPVAKIRRADFGLPWGNK